MTRSVSRDKSLYFKRGYKYQTTRPYHIYIPWLIPYAPIVLPFVIVTKTGEMKIFPGYAWNGASGPTWDTLNSMIGSLIHDIGYQLIRLGLIPPHYKSSFDQLLHNICIEDGMFPLRAHYWEWAVLTFGAGSTRPSAEPKEEVAP